MKQEETKDIGEGSKAKTILMAFATRVINNAKKLEPQLQELCVRIAEHAKEYGDATPALYVYENLPKSQRRKAMAVWWKTYTQILIKDSATNGISVKLNRKADWNIEEGKNNPFYLLDENNVGRAMGEIDALSILTKKLESLQKRIEEWENAPDESAKLLIFKPGVNPIHEAEKLQRDINALSSLRSAA